MKQLSKIRGYLVLVAIVIILVFGAFWFQEYLSYQNQPAEEENNFLTYIDRGLSEEVSLMFEQQIAELLVSIESQGDEPDLNDLLRLGNAYNTIGELAKAKEIYGQILVRAPHDTPALENLGTTLYLMEDYYGAEEAWLAAAEISGSEPHVLKLVDLINNHIPEHKDKVKDILELAVLQLGQTPGLLAALGEWYFEDGQYDRAVSHYEVAIDINSDNKELQTRLEEIENVWKNSK